MMKNAKTTKRALLLSVLSLLVCVAMLIGSTFAWFTDVATTGVNSITTGTLDLAIEDAYGNAVSTLSFVDANGSSSILWEPGASFKLDKAFKIVNNGSLALKYKVELSAFTGDTKLLDVIDLTVNGEDWETFWAAQSDIPLAPNTDSGMLQVVGTMSTEAGNAYQGKTLNAVKITVLATQQTAEVDMTDDQYDAAAEYPVRTAEELEVAVATGKNAILANDIKVDEKMNVGGDAVINLNGKTLDAGAMNGTTATIDRPFYMTEGASLTINGEGGEVVLGGHGLINVPSNVKDAEVIINGGTYTGTTNLGTLVRLRGGNEDVAVVLNDVTYNDASNNGYIVSTDSFAGNGTLVVNGGSFSGNYGFQIHNMKATLKNVAITTRGTAVEASTDSDVTVEDCTINVTPGVQVVNAPAAGIAASHGGAAVVKNCAIASDAYGFAIYNSGGSIVANGCTITAAAGNYKPTGSITIDGVAI